MAEQIIMPKADWVAGLNKIRERGGATGPIKSGEFEAAVANIPQGGSNLEKRDLTGFPYTSNGIKVIKPSPDYDGMSEVKFSISVPSGGSGPWSKVEVEQWTPAENTQQYPLSAAVAGTIGLLTISRPYAGAVDHEIRFAAVEAPVDKVHGACIVTDFGATGAIDYVSFLNALVVAQNAPYTWIGGQTYTVTKCYK